MDTLTGRVVARYKVAAEHSTHPNWTADISSLTRVWQTAKAGEAHLDLALRQMDALLRGLEHTNPELLQVLVPFQQKLSRGRLLAEDFVLHLFDATRSFRGREAASTRLGCEGAERCADCDGTCSCSTHE